MALNSKEIGLIAGFLGAGVAVAAAAIYVLPALTEKSKAKPITAPEKPATPKRWNPQIDYDKGTFQVTYTPLNDMKIRQRFETPDAYQGFVGTTIPIVQNMYATELKARGRTEFTGRETSQVLALIVDRFHNAGDRGTVTLQEIIDANTLLGAPDVKKSFKITLDSPKPTQTYGSSASARNRRYDMAMAQRDGGEVFRKKFTWKSY